MRSNVSASPSCRVSSIPPPSPSIGWRSPKPARRATSARRSGRAGMPRSNKGFAASSSRERRSAHRLRRPGFGSRGLLRSADGVAAPGSAAARRGAARLRPPRAAVRRPPVRSDFRRRTPALSAARRHRPPPSLPYDPLDCRVPLASLVVFRGQSDLACFPKRRGASPPPTARRTGASAPMVGAGARAAFHSPRSTEGRVVLAMTARREPLYPAGRRFSWTVNPSCPSTLTAPVFPPSKSVEASRSPVATHKPCPRLLSGGKGSLPRSAHKSW